MTILSGDRRLGDRKDTPDGRARPSDDVMTEIMTVLRRSNHATALAGWTVTTVVMGLVIQVPTVRAIESTRATLLLVVLLLPIFAAVGRVVVLLSRAAQAATDAGTAVGGAEGSPTGAAADLPPAPGERPDRSVNDQPGKARSGTDGPTDERPHDPPHDRSNRLIDDLIATTRVRNRLAQRALNLGYGCGIAFLAWSLLVAVLSAGG